jgi:hypothetical protein
MNRKLLLIKTSHFFLNVLYFSLEKYSVHLNTLIDLNLSYGKQ